VVVEAAAVDVHAVLTDLVESELNLLDPNNSRYYQAKL
jgi:hypothetical protein